jgi:hypothetical protein
MSPTLIPVFRKGAWIQYSCPPNPDPLWASHHFFRAASAYASALSQGHTSQEAAILAEAFINKEVYFGLKYDSSLEKQLERLMF